MWKIWYSILLILRKDWIRILSEKSDLLYFLFQDMQKTHSTLYDLNNYLLCLLKTSTTEEVPTLDIMDVVEKYTLYN